MPSYQNPTVRTFHILISMRNIILAGAALTGVAALVGPVGRLPAMGFNSYNAFAGDYDASILLETAQIMNERGLVDAGYRLMVLDDFYSELERNETGHMVDNREKFPDGIASFSRDASTFGLGLGAYGDNGYKTCGGHPGSFNHELQDLETWYSWGMAYVKYDNCCKLYCLSISYDCYKC